ARCLQVIFVHQDTRGQLEQAVSLIRLVVKYLCQGEPGVAEMDFVTDVCLETLQDTGIDPGGTGPWPSLPCDGFCARVFAGVQLANEWIVVADCLDGSEQHMVAVKDHGVEGVDAGRGKALLFAQGLPRGVGWAAAADDYISA